MLCALDGLLGDMLHAAMTSPGSGADASGLTGLDIAGAVGLCTLVLMLAAWCWSWAGSPRPLQGRGVADWPDQHG